jgi:predicted XRE-type DNA-binding protein
MWGCYKPNTPRANAQKPGKFIKYEHPPKVELSIFLLDVPPSVAERIYSKHKVNPNQGDRANGFWYCVWKHNIPLTITEGAKKAACLLSNGHAAIGLPGIYAGYRSKDELGEPISPVLHEELAVFATPNRQIQFCFDYETKPKTKLQVEIAIWRTGRLLEQQGAKVLVVTLPGPDKGVDDFIVARGPLAYENLSHDAPTFQDWHRHNQQRAAAIQPPRKLTPEQRLERHKQGTGNGQQPTENDLLDLLISPKLEEIKKAISCSPFPIPCSQQNQSIGQTHDINRQQPNPDTVINREDFGILSENREPRSEQLETNRENRILRKEPNREHERVESQSLELLTGINQYVERKQVEQLGDDIARISQSLTINGLRGQRTTNLSTEVNGQDSAIFDRKASYVHPSQSTNGQLLNAISDYVEQSAISRALTETVLEVTQQLFQYKEQLVTAKATFNDLDTVLATELQSRTEKRAISSISNYVEQSAISRALTETLLEVTQQLSQYKEQLVTAKTAFNDLDAALAAELQFRTEKRAISSISDYVEQSAISRALTETLLEVTQQLSRYKEQLVTAKATFNDLDSLLAAELQSYSNNRAISSIDGEVEPATKETLASTLLGEVKSSLKQIIQGLDEERLAEVVMEVGKYIKSEFMTGEKVNELFTTVTPPNLFLTFEQKMNIVRQLIRDDKPSIMERLRTKFQQSDDDEQIRFRR